MLQPPTVAATFAEETGSTGVLRPGRLRWLRALAWMIALIVPIAAAQVAIALLLRALGGELGDGGELLVAVLSALIVLAVYAGVVRLAERRWPHELDPRRLIELPLGLLLGVLMFSAVIAVMVGLDWYDLARSDARSPLDALSLSVQSGVIEEILLRAIIFRLLTRALNVWWALAISAALFGALHLANPNATPFAALAIALEAGVMLAAFYVWTGRLWLSIGVHAAWNFAQGYLYGAAVSGTDFGDSLMSGAPDAGDPALLTGGAFGPEASLAALLVCTAVGAGVLYAARGRLRSAPGAPQVPTEP